MKPKTALMIAALVAISAASGCARTEYIEVRPQCTPPVTPVLPLIERGELWDALGDSRYRELERYLNVLWGYADEQSAMLNALCNAGESAPDT